MEDKCQERTYWRRVHEGFLLALEDVRMSAELLNSPEDLVAVMYRLVYTELNLVGERRRSVTSWPITNQQGSR
jgi:hypothetical protein